MDPTRVQLWPDTNFNSEPNLYPIFIPNTVLDSEKYSWPGSVQQDCINHILRIFCDFTSCSKMMLDVVTCELARPQESGVIQG